MVVRGEQKRSSSEESDDDEELIRGLEQKPSQEHHFHLYGHIGVLFIDMRGGNNNDRSPYSFGGDNHCWSIELRYMDSHWQKFPE